MGLWIVSFLLALNAGIAGKVLDAKGTPVPAATVRLTAAAGAPVLETVTEPDGTFAFAEAPPGSCALSVEMAGFQKVIRQVDAASESSRSLSITLSRAAAPSAAPSGRPSGASLPGPRTAPGSRPAFAEIEMTASGEGSAASSGGSLTADAPAPARQGDSSDVLVITGNASASLDAGDWSDPAFRARMAEMGQRMGFGDIDQMGRMGPGERGEGGPPGMGGPGFTGGPGIGGPGMGGPMGGRGFGGMGGGRGVWQRQQKFNVSIFSNYRNSALNAKSYSLTGAEVSKPLQIQNDFGLSVGGVLPWGSRAQAPSSRRPQQPGMWFFSYEGNRNRNPFDVLTTVPTLLERAGDFSQSSLTAGPFAGQGVAIYDPGTGSAFAGSRIPASRLNPASVALLRYIPEPNLPRAVQNFTMQRGLANRSDVFSGRINSRISAKDNVFVNYSFRRGDSIASQIFPGLDTDRNNRSQNLGIGGVHRFQPRLILNFRASFNRVRTSTTNPFSYLDDVAGALGITGISRDPINFGIPTITFTNYGDLQVGNPALLRTQTVMIGSGLSKLGTRHSIQTGGDLSWNQRNNETDPNARGTFDFTGFATSAFTAAGKPVPGTGYDFADFLLGLPYGTSRRFGDSLTYLRNRSINFFVQDNWRARPNLTLNLGLRYEYIQPLYEKYDHMVSLDIGPGFLDAAQVFPGGSGPYSGVFPRSLVFSDKNNFAPRIGVAWKPKASGSLVVRAGYGILYNPAVYPYIAAQLVGQPPFAISQTLLTTAAEPLTLQAGFPVDPSVTIRNSYAIDPNYRIGYIQQWNLNVQMPLRKVYVLEAGYLGSKGTRLDQLRAPNRSLEIGNAEYFLYQQSGANSVLHSMRLRLARRLTNGLRIENSYTLSKSIDDASGIGGASLVVAQNDANLFAERSLSSFDQRHRFQSNFNYALPIGQNRRFMAGASAPVQNFVSGWEISGTYQLNSGQPLTARILGNVSNNSGTGSFSSERPDSTGISPSLPSGERSTSSYFNTLAFAIPAAGAFGNAGRYTIIGPGSNLLNLSLRKNFRLNEGARRLEFRWQVTNALNHPNYAGLGTVVNALNFGRVTSVRAMRQMEVGLRLTF